MPIAPRALISPQPTSAPDALAAGMVALDELLAPIEDATDKEEITIEDEAEEEEEPLKVAHDPKLPSVADVESHRCSHIPYGSWCKWCKMGRGRGDSHSAS